MLRPVGHSVAAVAVAHDRIDAEKLEDRYMISEIDGESFAVVPFVVPWSVTVLGAVTHIVDGDSECGNVEPDTGTLVFGAEGHDSSVEAYREPLIVQ